jgi:hypothetical protein
MFDADHLDATMLDEMDSRWYEQCEHRLGYNESFHDPRDYPPPAAPAAPRPRAKAQEYEAAADAARAIRDAAYAVVDAAQRYATAAQIAQVDALSAGVDDPKQLRRLRDYTARTKSYIRWLRELADEVTKNLPGSTG